MTNLRAGLGGQWPWLAGVWACFVVRLAFYSIATPIWDGYDEYAHFAMLREVAFGEPLPDPQTARTSRFVEASLELAPVPWVIHDDRAGRLSYDAYWSLPEAERGQRQSALRVLRTEGSGRAPLYEAQQAPLYYWMMAPFVWLVSAVDLPVQVILIRLAGVLMASSIIPIAFLIAGRSLAVPILIAALPEMLPLLGRITNDSLAVPLGGVALLLTLSFLDKPAMRTAMALGVAVGLALLTKAYFLALLPMVFAAFVMAGWRQAQDRRVLVRSAVVCMLACTVIAGWWYVRNLAITHSLTGEQMDAGAWTHSRMSIWSAMAQTRWRRVLDFFALSSIWLGGWSFLVLRSWMYRVVEVVGLAAAVGVCMQLVRPRPGPIRPTRAALLVIAWLAMLGGLCYHAVVETRVTGNGGALGHYLHGLVPAEAVLVVTGLRRIFRERGGRWAIAGVVAIFVALDSFGIWCIQLPYYAGLIRHDASGNLHPYGIGNLPHDWRTLMNNLAAIKSGVVGPGVLTAGAVAAVCAGLVLVGMAAVLARSKRQRKAACYAQ